MCYDSGRYVSSNRWNICCLFGVLNKNNYTSLIVIQIRFRTFWTSLVAATEILKLVIERFWLEINNRVNYPVKDDALIGMVEIGLNMDDDLVQFSVSWITMRTCQIGVQLAVSAWNHHHIQGTVVTV